MWTRHPESQQGHIPWLANKGASRVTKADKIEILRKAVRSVIRHFERGGIIGPLTLMLRKALEDTK